MNAEGEDQFPDSFFCPLTYQLMKDPVVDPEGNTYERSAIEDWLKINPTSPITRSSLQIKDLAPNRALKEAITRIVQETGISKIERLPTKQNFSRSHETVSLSVSASKEESNITKIMTSIHPDDGKKRTPVDIACVVDVSGSMSAIATFQNEQGNKESHGLTILDIVKHAVSTIIHSLGPTDRLSIVAYSTKAEIITPLTWMNTSGQEISKKKLKQLEPLAATNLWDGLSTGMDILRNGQEEGRLESVFILTDGMPNITPPRGHLPMLKRYKQRHKWECLINSFGFGYTMDSKLLHELALEGEGMYAFIPDSGFVGTTFVNALSNLLVVQAKNVHVNIEIPPSYEFVSSTLPSLSKIKSPTACSVPLSTLHYGQTRDLVVQISPINNTKETDPGANTVSVTATYLSATGSKVEVLASKISVPHTNETKEEIEQQYFRQQLVLTLSALSKDLPASQVLVKEFLAKMKNSVFIRNEYMNSLLQDMEGQVSEAVSKEEFYEKWGVHYLPSLSRAHQLQQCNNFKDPGIQSYGGELFNDIRDIGDDIFVSLPPPEPSGDQYVSSSNYSSSSSNHSSSSSHTSTYQSSFTPVSMNAYYCSSNPCFSGQSLVCMSTGRSKRCDLIQKGDLVRTGNGHSAKVLCVIQTQCAEQREELVHIGKLQITPYHPVRIGNEWKFPCDIYPIQILPCSHVYSFVLSSHHSMVINGIECVTLGHNFTESVVAHPYFGSTAVINDLKQMDGWSRGLIQFSSGCMIKDSCTDLVCAFNTNSILQSVTTSA